MLEAVVDTNVLVSAFTGGRVTGVLYTALKAGAFRLVVSPELLSEILAVLARREFGLAADDLTYLHAFLLLHAIVIEPTTVLSVCRDPADDRILECAVTAHVPVIVTGDRDLLALHPFRGIDIITPRAFLSRLS